MKKFALLTVVLLIFASTLCWAQPPYGGTIYVDSTILRSSDPSTFVSITPAGQAPCVVYDRRANGFITVNAFLFNVVWDDGLTCQAQVNPEFANNAAVEAEKYARLIGQLPTCLRVDVDEIWIHKGNFDFGGGNHSILIHTERSPYYEGLRIMEETLIHESSHTSLDFAHALAPNWFAAQDSDGIFISTYAEANDSTEDIAESFLTWIAVRQCSIRISQTNYNIITQTIPHRLAYFDAQGFDMHPLCLQSVGVDEVVEEDISIYPNPAADFITIDAPRGVGLQLLDIYSVDGKVVLQQELYASHQTVDVSPLTKGVYLLVFTTKEGGRYTKKWMKD